ncbi:medium-chain acyl-CoA ligase ACSF2, mitochondrial-like [Periplaneta americana]|uniref:medium-chain acyl-CoA ligase ACSF2, mitochondrial-like n=1 Tax=Periplaneta americana TaxID=6978 RepID=UPI0037E98D25
MKLKGVVHVLIVKRYCSTKTWQRPFKPSYWYNPGSEPLTPMTTGQLVELAADKWGDKEALVSMHQKHRLTFKQVCEKADQLAGGLLDLGVKRGDRLGIWGPNSSEWYLTQMAAARAGLVLVNINPAYQTPELLYCLNKVGVKALIAAERFKSQDYHQMVQNIAPELMSSQPGKLESKAVPTLRSLIFISEQNLPGAFRFDDILGGAKAESIGQIRQMQDDIQPDEGCNIQFTSGTTGNPKATLLSHHNIVNNSLTIGKGLGYHLQEHRICLQAPFFHCFGNVVGVLSAMHYGATIVIPGASFKAEESLSSIDQEKCTIVYGTPTMYVDLVRAVDRIKPSLTSLQAALSTGSHCSQQLFEQMLDKLKVERVCSVYGLTETSPVVFQTHMSDTREQTTTTLGHSLAHLEVKIVDADGKMVPLGTPGELYVRGYSTMLCYWGDEDKTKEAIGQDGWFKTGDQFVLQEDGLGRVVGRLKDMIIRGGENIFPKEIEDFLQTHPDILEAQVFGIADERLGEEVCAAVRVTEGSTISQSDLKAYCKGKISHFKVPRYLMAVSEFPKTTSGKIQKFKLKEMLENKLGISK